MQFLRIYDDFEMNNFEQFEQLFDNWYKEKYPNLEPALIALRSAGASQMVSVLVVRKIRELSLNEADSIVINSATWSDLKDGVAALRDAFADAVEQKWDAENSKTEIPEK